jgi:hypothetical protein
MTRAFYSAVVFAIILAIAFGCEKAGEGEGAAPNIIYLECFMKFFL